MGIGGSIFLIAVGAIIAFGVNADVGWLDLSIVGWVLILAGLAGLFLTLWFWQSRRRRAVVRTVPVQDDRRAVVEEQYRSTEVRSPDGW
jgi:protein-S-isoprenylcysteine O-methyltransferase Ste14